MRSQPVRTSKKNSASSGIDPLPSSPLQTQCAILYAKTGAVSILWILQEEMSKDLQLKRELGPDGWDV